MDVAKRNQFIARLSRALGRDQEMCPAFVNVLVQNSLKLHLTN